MDIVEQLRSIGGYSIETIRYGADEIESLRQQLAESRAREKMLRATMSQLAGRTQYAEQERIKALAMPSDSTALDEAIRQAEERVEASYQVELDLLREIGEILEPVEYIGSYADGIKTAIKQAKREALLEAVSACERQVILQERTGAEMDVVNQTKRCAADIQRIADELQAIGSKPG